MNLHTRRRYDYVVVPALVWMLSFFAFRLWDFNFKIPIQYEGDTIVMLAYVKALLINDWNWNIPQLSAPYTFGAAGFPLMTNFDWLIMKMLGVFSSDVAVVVNVFWFLTLSLSALTAFYALVSLGSTRFYAYAASLVYAFLPYIFARNISHLNLVYYLVPLLVGLALVIATPNEQRECKVFVRVAYIACAAQGFDYIYFSFFSVVIFVFAGFYGRIRYESRLSVMRSLLAIGIVVFSTGINLAPSFLSWHVDKPAGLGYKSPAEAEYYGAKIRRLVVPNRLNRLPLLGAWGRADSAVSYPNENENVTARLGVFCTFGFLALLLVSFGLLRDREEGGGVVSAAAAISIFTLLVITVGGFGAIFNLLVAPDIRAYNRFSVFLAFISLAGLGALLSCNTANSRNCDASGSFKVCVLIACLTCISLYDQFLDKERITDSQRRDAKLVSSERALVSRLERMYPKGGSVFQLPILQFPLNIRSNDIYPYDQLRPFLWSDGRFKWSYPSFSAIKVAWDQSMMTKSPKEVIESAVLSGFDLLWLDSAGFSNDSLIQYEAALDALGATSVLKNETGKILIFDLSAVRSRIAVSYGATTIDRERFKVLNPVGVEFPVGFYGEEINGQGMRFRWSGQNSVITVKNFSAAERCITLRFVYGSEGSGRIDVVTGGAMQSLETSSEPRHAELPLVLGPGKAREINMTTSISKVNAPGDPRAMYFYIGRLEAVAQNACAN